MRIQILIFGINKGLEKSRGVLSGLNLAAKLRVFTPDNTRHSNPPPPPPPNKKKKIIRTFSFKSELKIRRSYKRTSCRTKLKLD